MPTTWLIQAAESGDLDLLKLFYSIGIDANFNVDVDWKSSVRTD